MVIWNVSMASVIDQNKAAILRMTVEIILMRENVGPPALLKMAYVVGRIP